MYDTIIIGSGPAGLTAAIYLLRSNKKIKIFEKEGVGGQISSSPLVENYPGFKSISGPDLINNLYEQVESLGGEIEFEEVLNITKDLTVTTDSNTYKAKTIIIATGAKYRKLNLENEEKLIGNGIHFCVSCDGAFYKDKTVGVIGGGNTAIINAISLSDICKKVYVIQNLNKLTAEEKLIENLNKKSNIEIIYNSKVTKYLKEETLTGIEINKEKEIKLDGIFLSIGLDPESGIFEDLLNINEYGYIKTDNTKTNIDGIFVAGDVRDKKVRQLTVATSDGTIAAINAIECLNRGNND